MSKPIAHRMAAMSAVIAATLCLTACSGVSDLTKQQVARSETAVNQAQTTLGSSEAGAIELQQAKQKLSQAQQAVQKGEEQPAQRAATMAELDAQLAVAKSQSAASRKAADELLASIQQIKQEASRPAQR